MFQKPPLMATIFMICGVALLCTLGVWQIQRLQWKENLLAQIDAAYSADVPDVAVDRDAAVYTRGILEGRYDDAHAFKLAPRTFDGEVGYYLIVPFILNDGDVVLVNRGWVMQNYDGDVSAPSGALYLKGMVRLPARSNMFTPQNMPEQNVWYSINPDQIAAVFGYERERLWDYVFYAQEERSEGVLYPVSLSGKPEVRNDHLGYAFFWFSLAGVLFVIFVLRFVFVRKGM